ncbi:alpha/beta hydrolase [Tissierella sp. MB52-C2]|uniref:alpha/beta hydrolase n=1 Tax=Tissierella sp. MB52-C2 TaxID=3070999 RepID=UPI00280B7AB8|nr:alpha/beta hydrolase [Tissierella sp. MB52-C2]WMM26103.1 alpha/beta hydrolase [Tissierella sp. MB52-C2]
MIKEDIKIPIDHGRRQIAATVERPGSGKNSDILIVMIPGSGPVDRDGNMRGMRANIYKQLAGALGQEGFATLRYDKIGIGESKGDFNCVGLEDAVQCVSDIIDYCNLSEDMAFRKIFLLGHSEGTIIATLSASRKQVNGIILLCGAGTSLKSVITSQNELLLSEIANKSGLAGMILRKLISPKKHRLKQQKLFDKVMQTEEPTVRISGKIVQAKWLREHLALNDQKILELLSSLNCKVLAIHGSKDVQSPIKPFYCLKGLTLDNIQTIIIDDMNHMLKNQKESCSLLLLKKIYKKLANEPIVYDLIHEIENWIQAIG